MNSDGSAGSYANLDVAVLHKDYETKFTLEKVFLNPLLMHVFAAIIRGPTAAIAMANPVKGTIPPTDTMESRHGITHITPGAIAATAVLVRWVLSADEKLQSRGAMTGVNYDAAFQGYLEYLMAGLWDKKPSVENIIRQWDTTLFPHSGTSLVRSQGDNAAEEFRKAKELLAAEERAPSDDEPAAESSSSED